MTGHQSCEWKGFWQRGKAEVTESVKQDVAGIPSCDEKKDLYWTFAKASLCSLGTVNYWETMVVPIPVHPYWVEVASIQDHSLCLMMNREAEQEQSAGSSVLKTEVYREEKSYISTHVNVFIPLGTMCMHADSQYIVSVLTMSCWHGGGGQTSIMRSRGMLQCLSCNWVVVFAWGESDVRHHGEERSRVDLQNISFPFFRTNSAFWRHSYRVNRVEWGFGVLLKDTLTVRLVVSAQPLLSGWNRWQRRLLNPTGSPAGVIDVRRSGDTRSAALQTAHFLSAPKGLQLSDWSQIWDDNFFFNLSKRLAAASLGDLFHHHVESESLAPMFFFLVDASKNIQKWILVIFNIPCWVAVLISILSMCEIEAWPNQLQCCWVSFDVEI